MTFFGIIKHNFFLYMPAICTEKCSRNRVKERMFQQSFRKLAKELDIIHFLQKFRAVKKAIQAKTKQQDWQRFKSEAKVRQVWLELNTKSTQNHLEPVEPVQPEAQVPNLLVNARYN